MLCWGSYFKNLSHLKLLGDEELDLIDDKMKLY